MELDLTSPVTLTKKLNEHLPPKRFFTETFFGEQVHGTVGVAVDIVKGSTKIAPYGARGEAATVATRDGFVTKTFNTYSISLKRPTTAIDMFKRAPGEAVTYVGERNAATAAAELMSRDQAELANMVNRAIEKYAIDALFNGSLTILGETISFGMQNSHNVDVSASKPWDGSSADIEGDVEGLATVVAQDSGLTITDMVLGSTARKAFMSNTKVLKNLDTRNLDAGNLKLDLMVNRGARFLGVYGGIRCWAYDEVWNNNGTITPMVPANKVILLSKDMRATVHYGLIDDVQGGKFAAKMFSKTWAQEDPSIQWVGVKSSPLPVIEQVDGYAIATVIA